MDSIMVLLGHFVFVAAALLIILLITTLISTTVAPNLEKEDEHKADHVAIIENEHNNSTSKERMHVITYLLDNELVAAVLRYSVVHVGEQVER